MPNSQRKFLSSITLYTCTILILGFIHSPAFAADITAPVTTRQMTPADPNGNDDWYTVPVEFTLTSTDLESGVAEIRYRVDLLDWQVVSFDNSLNLAPNPSFEFYDGTSSSRLVDWAATTVDANTVYSQDQINYLSGFETSSAKIVTTGTGWHGINHMENFAVASPFSNMTASVWVKSANVTETAFFKVYSVANDINGLPTVFTEVAQSPSITGTVDWTQLSLNFILSDLNAVGVYIDLGLTGSGTVWYDAATLNDSLLSAETTFTVGADGEHTLEYYSIDRNGNQELHDCNIGLKCVDFKIDQTPPGNWNDAGAFRGFFGPSDHHLYVYTNVQDLTSGLSTFTDKYQINTPNNPEFGSFSDIMQCSSTWIPDQWTPLISPPFIPGVNSAYLLTPKTDFCDSNWKICKIVRFYSEDLAGNSATKDYCINGPWIKFRGEGIVRSEGGIDMVAEANGDNTDGLIEVGNNLLNFFSSSKEWVLKNSPTLPIYDYSTLDSRVPVKTTITGELPTTSGAYFINSDYTLGNSTIPNTYNTQTFTQLIFVNGDLIFDRDIEIVNNSAVLFVVNGNVYVKKTVREIHAGIFADGTIFTASDIGEGDIASTLNLRGVYNANDFQFQRTLQGTNNSDTPTEEFTFEPKYISKMKDYLGENSVIWVKVE